jgi:hypothetical protein
MLSGRFPLRAPRRLLPAPQPDWRQGCQQCQPSWWQAHGEPNIFWVRMPRQCQIKEFAGLFHVHPGSFKNERLYLHRRIWIPAIPPQIILKMFKDV